MVLTPRLGCIAGLVQEGARLADVGTDHAKLLVSLLLEGRLASAIGSDIHESPLSHAARNAEDYGVKKWLSLRLAAGLDRISPEECDTVSIAGMGGGTIAEILGNASWTARGDHLLLLQPMTMVYELRQWLWGNGYGILRETLCREHRRWYVVLSVRGGTSKCKKKLSECSVSPALLKAEGVKKYLAHLLMREQKALEGMKRGAGVDPARMVCQRERVDVLRDTLEGLK